jgi:hypothetical protein
MKQFLILSTIFCMAIACFLYAVSPDRTEYKLYKLQETNETFLGQEVEWNTDSTFTIDSVEYNVKEYVLIKEITQ